MGKKDELLQIIKSFKYDLELRNTEVRFLDDKIVIHTWDEDDKWVWRY